MNSLEFIEKEIKQLEKRKENAFKNEYYSVYKECSQKIIALQQIKSELEAWEELNELFIIKPYYQDKENNKHPAIMIQQKIEKDFEYVRRGCKQKSFDTIKKALEEKHE